MLELKNVTKIYKSGDFTQKALNDIDIKFRSNEFVAILGPSGSGKTTLLNIIGGLDRYTAGDLLIKGKSTKKFKDKDWDAYRNKSVGFVFQSYNLIPHIDILSNVEMGMTLSGKKKSTRRKKAIELLNKVGLKDHKNKKPNQLSGGQMQRVAIARALSNDPEIILADEPTGALDTKTSKQIMELIKEIANDKLVIMVTHNPEIANTYADRIIAMQDGKVINDSNPVNDKELKEEYKLKKTKMSFLTALSLSLNNIMTKKGRTVLTAFASSIGIIGIALILSLSNGFQIQIDKFEHDTSDAMPVVITPMKSMSNEGIEETISSYRTNDRELYPDDNKVYVKEEKTKSSFNNITIDYFNYLKDNTKDYVSSLMFNYGGNLALIQKYQNDYLYLSRLEKVNLQVLPISSYDNLEISNLITDYYDLLAGSYPSKKEEILLEISSSNKISLDLAKALGLESQEYSFDDILNRDVKLVFNDTMYSNYGDSFFPNPPSESIYNSEDNLTLKVVGIIRVKEEKDNLVMSSDSLYYTQELINYVHSIEKDSKIVVAQRNSDKAILTGELFSNYGDDGEAYKKMMLASLNDDVAPTSIYLYPKDFNAKDEIVKVLDNYNRDKNDYEKVTYIDQAKLITSVTSGIMDGITIALIAFSSISLVVSSIMLGIITYISVLERTKEIGILRALGARKKDISRVFNAEVFIIGLTSGILGIGIAFILLFPINRLLLKLTDLKNVGVLNPIHAIALIIISLILTLIGGFIPSHIASKKDPVVALRTE